MVRWVFAASAQLSSSESTVSSRVTPWLAAAASGLSAVSHCRGNSTRASAYWPAFTRGTW